MSSGQWWVVWTAPPSGLKYGQRQFHVISAVTPPAAASNDFGGLVLQVDGPYLSRAAAETAVGSSTGTSGTGPGIANPNNKANQPPANPLGGLAGIGDFFGRLTEASTWVRVGEVVLGLILVAVGIARITHAVPIATKIAKTAGMAAAV